MSAGGDGGMKIGAVFLVAALAIASSSAPADAWYRRGYAIGLTAIDMTQVQ